MIRQTTRGRRRAGASPTWRMPTKTPLYTAAVIFNHPIVRTRRTGMQTSAKTSRRPRDQGGLNNKGIIVTVPCITHTQCRIPSLIRLVNLLPNSRYLYLSNCRLGQRITRLHPSNCIPRTPRCPSQTTVRRPMHDFPESIALRQSRTATNLTGSWTKFLTSGQLRYLEI
jgi:hypothetical protein